MTPVTMMTTRRTRIGRRGFTLLEMIVVLAIMGVAAGLVAPALVSFGAQQPAGSADALLALLRDARLFAIQHNDLVTLRLDPTTLEYEADTSGVFGTGVLAMGKLDLGGALSLSTDQPRLRYVFQPTGAAFADTVLIHGGDRAQWVGVDSWSGVASAQAR
jgi:type IV fimbrial biogenesis protein FimT